MHSTTRGDTLVVGRVDAHADTHDAAALDERGAPSATKSFPTTTPGYRQLLAWLSSFGEIDAIAVESTGSYAASLGRYLREHNIKVVEVNQPHAHPFAHSDSREELNRGLRRAQVRVGCAGSLIGVSTRGGCAHRLRRAGPHAAGYQHCCDDCHDRRYRACRRSSGGGQMPPQVPPSSMAHGVAEDRVSGLTHGDNDATRPPLARGRRRDRRQTAQGRVASRTAASSPSVRRCVMAW
jgi:Transposase